MKTKFVPAQPGTIRGPFSCGNGNDPRGGIQYAVRTKDGYWHYFFGTPFTASSTLKEAQEYAKTQE